MKFFRKTDSGHAATCAYLAILRQIVMVATFSFLGCQTALIPYPKACPDLGRSDPSSYGADDVLHFQAQIDRRQVVDMPARMATGARQISTQAEYKDFVARYRTVCGDLPPWREEIEFLKAERTARDQQTRQERLNSLEQLRREVADLRSRVETNNAQMEGLRTRRATLVREIANIDAQIKALPGICIFGFSHDIYDRDANGVYVFGTPLMGDSCYESSPGVIRQDGTLYVQTPKPEHTRNPRILVGDPYYFVGTTRGRNRQGATGLINIYSPVAPPQLQQTVQQRDQLSTARRLKYEQFKQVDTQLQPMLALAKSLQSKEEAIRNLEKQLGE